MATGKHMIQNVAVRVNSVDLSDHVNEATVTMSADDLDVTGMGQGAKDHLAGLRDDSYEIVFFQDFASGKVDATLSPLQSSTGFLMEVWPDGTVTSSTNPKYSSTVIMLEYTPISGAVGDANQATISFPSRGSITRATA